MCITFRFLEGIDQKCRAHGKLMLMKEQNRNKHHESNEHTHLLQNELASVQGQMDAITDELKVLLAKRDRIVKEEDTVVSSRKRVEDEYTELVHIREGLAPELERARKERQQAGEDLREQWEELGNLGSHQRQFKMDQCMMLLKAYECGDHCACYSWHGWTRCGRPAPDAVPQADTVEEEDVDVNSDTEKELWKEYKYRHREGHNGDDLDGFDEMRSFGH
eukprot:gene18533-852_t